MTTKNVENTLKNLEATVKEMRLQGKAVNRVRIGVELMQILESYNYTIIKYFGARTIKRTIMGLPIDIDFEEPMCLEVCTTERVYVEGVRNE